MAKLCALAFALAACVLLAPTTGEARAHGGDEQSQAQAAAGECSKLVHLMAGCVGYLRGGGKGESPGGACCAGLKAIERVAGSCICDWIKTSEQLGVHLNFTKAANLPSACGLPSAVAFIKSCALEAPSPAVSNSSRGGEITAHSPAPSPSNACVHSSIIPAILLAFCSMAVASLSFI